MARHPLPPCFFEDGHMLAQGRALFQGAQPRRVLIAILLGALVARLAFVILFGHTLSLQASGYDTYAVNVLEGQGYTRFEDRSADSDLPPLYVFTLIAIYSTLGRSAVNVALVQTGFDLLTIALVYAIGRRAFPQSAAPALLGATFTAFYPYMLFQNLSTNDTAIFTLLLLAGVYGAYRAAAAFEESPASLWQAARWPVFIGVVYGLAALTKTLVVLMLPLLALLWWRRIGFRRALGISVVVGLVLLAVIAPWIARNMRLHGALVLTSTNDGSNLHQGNNPLAADYLAQGWDVQWLGFEGMPEGLSEVEEAAWHRDQALAWLRANPDQWLRHFGQKFLTLWNPQITPYRVPPLEATSAAAFVDDAVYLYESAPFQAARIAHVLYFAPLLALGMLGLALALRDRQPCGPLIAVLVTITAAYLVFHPSTRYRMPADPALFLFSAYGAAWLWAWLARRKQKTASG
ncbi:MAG: glycosyltransferase family 39 protein [Anaerolineae bacterium]|nr:glycosyltransferase family 39 protein [Anaerolineae bacterium]